MYTVRLEETSICLALLMNILDMTPTTFIRIRYTLAALEPPFVMPGKSYVGFIPKVSFTYNLTKWCTALQSSRALPFSRASARATG